MSNKIREHVLIGPPQSHTEVELRRNVFWLAYAHQRYHLFVSPWRAYFPTTLMLYEIGTDRSVLIALDISDEDIYQTLPGTLEAFEAGVRHTMSKVATTADPTACTTLVQVDDGQERQTIFSEDLFTTHGSNVDDFGLYIKCTSTILFMVVVRY